MSAIIQTEASTFAGAAITTASKTKTPVPDAIDPRELEMESWERAIALEPPRPPRPLGDVTPPSTAIPVEFLAAPLMSQRARVIKSIEDRVLAALILVAISPLMLLIALAVKVTSRGPALFVQVRHGLHGRHIRVLKFRTMRHCGGMDVAFDDSGAYNVVPAMAGDTRVTALGRLLRNTSLDELPQFINVLRGDMSIVGPRPHALKLNDDYAPKVHMLMSRHRVKPGITGLAQISGSRGEIRNTEQMRRRVDFDLAYVRGWSLWVDLKIIAVSMVTGFYNRQP